MRKLFTIFIPPSHLHPVRESKSIPRPSFSYRERLDVRCRETHLAGRTFLEMCTAHFLNPVYSSEGTAALPRLPLEFLKVTGIIQAKCARGTKGDFNYVADAAAFHTATFTVVLMLRRTVVTERYAPFGCQRVHTTAIIIRDCLCTLILLPLGTRKQI